ncbi:hypothetical protein GFL80_24235 [Rhizobium leguminosarum bv. viciae]|uniref:hypothetical protein n=1 Tax=Rhizobium leguminosarum TaxID=384 RepID=UPI00144143F3|nr:hypothetical protein [Rhizobium leguminosarum]MDH6273640.1 hypothetical protein [Rhizobium leguminosarum]NKK01010.1 hypothetical protein [Rhizobium leguminosarum bv. viciae]NKK87285.1 hypothetical protein [Rhizobium leguminosarum bv. viciae]
MNAVAQKLKDLARINRLGGKGALADALDEAVEMLTEAEVLIRDFPFLIFRTPGSRSVVGASESGEYAYRLGEWARRRDLFLQKGTKK